MGVGVGEGVFVGVGEGVGVRVAVGVSVGLGVLVALGVGDGSGVNVSVGTAAAGRLGLRPSWQAGKTMTASKSVTKIPARDIKSIMPRDARSANVSFFLAAMLPVCYTESLSFGEEMAR